MNGSPSKAAVIVALAAFLLWPAPAGAQSANDPPPDGSGAPMVLTPPLAPAAETDSDSPGAPPATPRAPEGIEVGTLGEIATDYGGTLDPADGGFPVDMWRGTERRFVERLLPQLPVTAGSPALRDLARRLLLSSAEAPAGEPEINLMAVRAERLVALGDRAGAAALLDVLPQSQQDAATERLRLEASWLAGQEDAACAQVDGLIRRFDQDLYLQKAHIFCQAKAGMIDQATLGLDLLREQGHTEDETFFELMGVLTGLREDADIAALGEPQGLHLAMLRAAGVSLPAGEEPATDPASLHAALQSGDGAERLAAAERAVAAGIAGPEVLVQLYRAEPATPEEVAAVLDSAPDTPHDRAVLYQAAAQADQPTIRAALVHKALEAARNDGGYPAAARVYLPLVARLDPEPAIAAIAGEAGRVLYLGGRYERAAAWLDLARAEAPRNPDAATAVPALWLLAGIAGGEPLTWNAKSVAAWREAQDAIGDEDAALRAARLFAAIEGLGQSAGAAWRVLADPSAEAAQPLADSATWYALGDAAEAGRLGETVMLALFVLGPAGPGAAHPIALGQAVSALRLVGLDSDARAIAFEAALASGV